MTAPATRPVRGPDLSAADPWAVDRPGLEDGPADPGPPAPPQLTDVLAVWVLGAAGPVGRVLPNGENGRLGGTFLLGVALLLAATLPRRSGRWLQVVGPATALVLAALLVEPRVGRLPILLAFAGVAVAHAAIVRWRPWPGHPERLTARATLAVPFLVFGGLHWYRGGHLAITLAALAIALVVIEASSLVRARAASVERVLARGVTRLADGVGAAILFVALVPLAYLPGAVVALVERWRRHRHRHDTSWAPVSLPVERFRKDAAYPFASVEPSEARRRLAGGLAVALLVSGAVWMAVRPDDTGGSTAARSRPLPTIQPRSPEDPPIVFGREFAAAYSDLPAYRGVEWADALQQEETQIPAVDTFRGTYVNIRDGRRVTSAPPACDCVEASAWLLGGSAAWGWGQRDEHTIASQLVGLAADRGVALDLDNMGQRGAVFAEQVVAVEARLEREPAPDVIIFYNGFNETGVALADELIRGGDSRDLDMLGGSQQDLAVAERMEDLQAINDRVQEYLASGLGPKVGRATAEAYREQQQKMDEIASAYDVEVRYAFQPDAFASRHQLEPYEAISGLPTDTLLLSPLALAFDVATAELGSDVLDLRHVFDDEADQVFLGLVHHNEKAAGIVATALLPTVLDALPR